MRGGRRGEVGPGSPGLLGLCKDLGLYQRTMRNQCFREGHCEEIRFV